MDTTQVIYTYVMIPNTKRAEAVMLHIVKLSKIPLRLCSIDLLVAMQNKDTRVHTRPPILRNSVTDMSMSIEHAILQGKSLLGDTKSKSRLTGGTLKKYGSVGRLAIYRNKIIF